MAGGVDPKRVFSDAKLVALANAAQTADLAAVQKLLAQGVNVNAAGDIPGGKRMTVLVFAVLAPKIEPLQAILAAGANPNVVYEGNTSPLFFAIGKQNPQFAEVLLAARANPNGSAPSGSLLGEAMIQGKNEAAKLLLNAGADPNGTHDGDALLLNSIYWEKLQFFPTLIERGAKVTPKELQSLCRYGSNAAVDLDRNGEHFRNYAAAWDYLEKLGVKPPCARVR